MKEQDAEGCKQKHLHGGRSIAAPGVWGRGSSWRGKGRASPAWKRARASIVVSDTDRRFGGQEQILRRVHTWHGLEYT